MIFMDESMGKNGWTLFWMLATNTILQKIKQKNSVEIIYVGFFQKQFDTWNTQVTLQNHTSYFLNMKYIQALQHLNHIEC
jgi:hypothetical protein